MKNIKINYLTYYLLILYFMCGLIKTGIIVFFIVLIHELGHVFFAKIFNFKINSVTIYPFGGYTKLEKDINTSFYKDILLSLGGIIFQVILLLIFNILYKNMYLSKNTIDIFNQYNSLIMLFNLLPIIPLDGSIILENILSKFFSYKLSIKLNMYLSIFFLFIFFLFNYKYSLNNYMIIMFLLYKILENKKNINYVFNKFLLERYLRNYNYKSVCNSKKCNVSIIKKNIFYYFWKDNKWVNEKDHIKDYMSCYLNII